MGFIFVDRTAEVTRIRLVTMGVMLVALNHAALADPETPRIVFSDTASSSAPHSNAVPGCPNQGGILDSITVPVDQPLNLSVVVSSPAPAGGASFNVKSDNPAIVAAGDRRQGFTPTVFIPQGGTQSNQFTLYGNAVGQTVLRLTPLTTGYLAGQFPLGAWDINKSGSGKDLRFLDANDPAKTCRLANSATLSTAAATQASCGKSIKAVAADKINPLLLRTVSGLAGTACFEIVSTASLDQGQVQTPLAATSGVNSLNYGFSYYTPPGFYGDTTDSRTVQVEFSFTPNIGNGNTSKLRADLLVIRPPLVLVHGLWSSASTWSSDFVRDTSLPYRTSQTADYEATHAASFTSNATRVKDSVTEALAKFRQKSFAATQVDVAGHSMGGLLTRLYVDDPTYKRPDNLNQGDVHRLMTLDTPHYGSSFANLLVSLHNVGGSTATKLEATVSTLTQGGNILNGAVCDLAENSPALSALGGGTALRSMTINSTNGPPGSPAVPARYWGGVTFFAANSFENALTETYCTAWSPSIGPDDPPVCLSSAFYFPQATVDAFRFQEANDAVVSQSSQRGGIVGYNFPEYIHFAIPSYVPSGQTGVTQGANVAARTFAVFDGPDNGLAASLGGVPSDGTGHPLVGGTATAAADYAVQCRLGGPMKPAAQQRATRAAAPDARVNIISPVAGALYAQGDPVSVVVELSPPLTSRNTVGVTFVGVKHVAAPWTSGLRFTAVLPSTILNSGSLTLIPDFTDTLGNVASGAPVVVGVRPPNPPVAMALQQRNFVLAPSAAPHQLHVNGTLVSGRMLDISSAFSGTTYATSDLAVLRVSADGLVSIAGQGVASVSVRNGALSDTATFIIEDPAHPLPPSSVASQLQFVRSGFRLDRSSGFYVQDLSVTNNSVSSLAGPLYLVMKSLTAGVQLVSKSGLTEQVSPLGSPYLSVPLPGEGLSLPPGSTTKFTLKFLNPDRLAIAYTLDAVRSSSEP